MSIVANKLKKQFLLLAQKKVIDITSLRKSRQNSLENIERLNDMHKYIAQEVTDPLWSIYLLILDLTSTCMYDLASTKELKDFNNIAKKYQNIYLPSFPPMSPHSDSYYLQWELFDLAFGPSNETLCGIFYDLADILKLSPFEKDVIKKLSLSRMGLYLVCGHENGMIRLKELVTNKEFLCLCNSGYQGKTGQLWYVRILPPIKNYANYYIISTTPYVILYDNIMKWSNFFEMNNITNEDMLHPFMKYGPTIDFWNEYIFYGYCNFIDQAIFLSGIPDQKNTLPSHNSFNSHSMLSKGFETLLTIGDKKNILAKNARSHM